MGVVRREGDWRLEKREDGVYEITHENERQEVIFTPEYTRGTMDEYVAVAVPTTDVGSYAEAEGRFEELAHSTRGPSLSLGGSPSQSGDLLGVGSETTPIGKSSNSATDGFDGSADAEDLPPGGIALVLLAAGGIFLWSSDFVVQSTVFAIGGLFLSGGLAIFAWAFFVSDGVTDAVSYLSTVSSTDKSTSGSGDGPEKTPPAPERLKHDLIFDRAEQECEWCEEGTDHPEVHHIQPRSEGGPNTRKNLIVLCPNCHRKADSGALSRSKLRAKVRRLEDS